TLSRHLVRSQHCGEGNVFRRRLRLESLQHVGERDALPWNHHAPRLDAAQPVYTLDHLVRLEEILETVVSRLPAQAIHTNGPRLRLERAGVRLRILLVGTELVV